MRLRLLLLTGTVASLFLAVPFAESATGPTYPSVITIRASSPTYHGRVHIRNPSEHVGLVKSCRTHRKVKLFHLEQDAGAINRVGTTRSNGHGRWQIPVASPRPGKYFAVAKARVLHDRGDKVCERAASRRIIVLGG
jgi:hypothetical protein